MRAKAGRRLTAFWMTCVLVFAGITAIAGCGVSTAGGSGSGCPQCGSEDVVPIVYGLPDLEMQRQAEEGEIVLGG